MMGSDHFLDLPTEQSQFLREQLQGGGLEPPELPLGTLYPPKKIILTKIIYGLPLLLLKFFDLALPSRGYSTELSQFY